MDATKIQIYCRKPTLSEMEALFALGVTHVAWGVHPEDAQGLDLSEAIVRRAHDAGVGATLLVEAEDTPVIERVARQVQPDYLLVPAERIGRGLGVPELPGLARRLRPRTALMMSVPVRTAGSSGVIDSLGLARRYQDFAGCLILDTYVDNRCGCTGLTNDWEECTRIITASRCPVMLAGGLNVQNVAAAIRLLRPWGVDACSSLELGDYSKDLGRCADFMRAAREAGIVVKKAIGGTSQIRENVERT